ADRLAAPVGSTAFSAVVEQRHAHRRAADVGAQNDHRWRTGRRRLEPSPTNSMMTVPSGTYQGQARAARGVSQVTPALTSRPAKMVTSITVSVTTAAVITSRPPTRGPVPARM